MAELASRSQILIAAVFRSVIQMRHGQDHDCAGKGMAMTVHGRTPLAIEGKHLTL
jgi:hypothetical protein